MDKLSQLTGQLMLNPQAAKFASQIPANANCKALADKYAQLAPHNDDTSEAVCLAIENHVRTATAVGGFMDSNISRALSIIEDAQAQAKKRKAAAKRRANAKRRTQTKRGK
jgi:hypothetical protein